MLKNSKPKIRRLTEDLMKELNDMGFGKYYDSCYRKIDNIDTTAFYKPYPCCDGCFELAINLEHCCVGKKEIYPSVSIHTPYNSWWSDDWKVRDFTEDMEKFQRALKKDLKQLRKLGVIS